MNKPVDQVYHDDIKGLCIQYLRLAEILVDCGKISQKCHGEARDVSLIVWTLKYSCN
jgi:hypothetical protein